jgi:hypothetical protein
VQIWNILIADSFKCTSRNALVRSRRVDGVVLCILLTNNTSLAFPVSHGDDITAGKLPNAGTADRETPTRVLSPKDRFGDHDMLLLSYD